MWSGLVGMTLVSMWARYSGAVDRLNPCSIALLLTKPIL
jgi:hypothetical protein